MFRAPGELWIGTNALPHGWVPAQATLEGVRATSAQIAGILCHHETLFGLPFFVPDDDPLAVLANSYYGSCIPGRGNPDYSPNLDELLKLRTRLRELRLDLDPVYYFHFAEAYLPMQAEAAWQYATERGLCLLIDSDKTGMRHVSPEEIGLTSWAEGVSYLEAAWRRAEGLSTERFAFSTVPDHWFAAAVFPNSD